MISKSLLDITLSDLISLVGNVREGKTIEYKSALPNTTEKEIDSFVGGISALANTSGGDFVIGVTATKDGIAEKITGILTADIDVEKRRLESLLAEWLEPRLPRVDIHTVACGEGRHVLIVRVPRSWVAPHRLTKNNKFYGRNSSAKYPLDVGELRTAFVLGESTAERIREFRAGRLAKITAGETPVPLARGAAAVLHMIPLPSFADRRLIDVAAEIASGHQFPLPLSGVYGGNQAGINLDGIINYVSPSAAGATSYAQLFRSGAIEGVATLGEDDGRPYFVGARLANTIVSAARQYLRVLSSLDAGFPIFALLSLSGVTGCGMKYDAGGFAMTAGPLRDEVVAFPEVTFDGVGVDVPAILHPVFNIVWNAFGFAQCDMYSNNGVWNGTA